MMKPAASCARDGSCSVTSLSSLSCHKRSAGKHGKQENIIHDSMYYLEILTEDRGVDRTIEIKNEKMLRSIY